MQSNNISKLPTEDQIILLKQARDRVNPELGKKIDARLEKINIIQLAIDFAIKKYIYQIKNAENTQAKLAALDNSICLLDSTGDSQKEYLEMLLPMIIENIIESLPAIIDLKTQLKEEILSLPAIQNAIEESLIYFYKLGIEDIVNIIQYTGDRKYQHLDKVICKLSNIRCVTKALEGTEKVKDIEFKKKIINSIYENIPWEKYIDDNNGEDTFYDYFNPKYIYYQNYSPVYDYIQYLSDQNKEDLFKKIV